MSPENEKSKPVVAPSARGNAIGLGVALHREPVDGGPTRIAEVEEAGDLVEGLAGGVVDGLAEQPVAPVALHRHEHRVAAGHEEHDERQLEVGLLEERGVQVGLEVVDGDERARPTRGPAPSPR